MYQRNITYKNLYYHSLKIGGQAILRGIITKESIKRILCPLDVSRYYEIPNVANALRLKDGLKILDISSPKLLVQYLSVHYPGVTFYAIDKFRNELNSWKKIIKPQKNLKIIPGDAVNLKYPDNFFDEVFSISVIEHVGDENKALDSKMVQEVYRVLKGGGRFTFTTIISNKEKIYFRNKDVYSTNKMKKKKTFFYRLYTPDLIKRRLLHAAPFRLKYEEVCNYRFPIYEYIFNRFMPLTLLAGWLNFFIAPKLIAITKSVKHIGKRAEYFAILQK